MAEQISTNADSAWQVRRSQLLEEKNRLLPTADIGTMVIWYDRGEMEEDQARPAVVLKREAPGRVTIKVLYSGIDKHRTGVHYFEHPVHQQPNNPATIQSGAWSYVRGYKIPDFHYNLHREEIDRRLKAVELDEQLHNEARLKKAATATKPAKVAVT